MVEKASKGLMQLILKKEIVGEADKSLQFSEDSKKWVLLGMGMGLSPIKALTGGANSTIGRKVL